MSFDIAHFFRTNRVFFTWIAVFGLVWLAAVYGLFGLIFITFILSFTFNGLIEYFTKRTTVGRILWTVIIYILFLAILLTILSIVLPTIGNESTAFLKKFPDTLTKLKTWLDQMVWREPDMAGPVSKLKQYLSLEALVGVDAEKFMTVVFSSFNQITNYVSFFLLGTLFSFLILLDLPKLAARCKALRETRLGPVYEVVAPSLGRFGIVVGAAFRAQMLIALLNTFLTAVGLGVLGIHPILLLSTIVFFCGLIPVLGTFISSAPIVLLAFNSGGIGYVLWAIVMIIIVHTVETYVLNPRIVAAMFKISPLITLLILYVGHKLFGLWGMVLGVPVSVFIYRHIVLGPPAEPDPITPTPIKRDWP